MQCTCNRLTEFGLVNGQVCTTSQGSLASLFDTNACQVQTPADLTNVPAGVIAGAVVGCVLGVALIAAAIVFAVPKFRRKILPFLTRRRASKLSMTNSVSLQDKSPEKTTRWTAGSVPNAGVDT